MRMVDIYGCEGRYAISDDGQVFSIKNQSYLKTFVRVRRGGSALPSIAIRDNEGVRRIYFIHRLVALHYIPNPAPKIRTEVNHIDGDVQNSHYLNLEWMSRSENQAHAFHNGLHPGFKKKVTA